MLTSDAPYVTFFPVLYTVSVWCTCVTFFVFRKYFHCIYLDTPTAQQVMCLNRTWIHIRVWYPRSTLAVTHTRALTFTTMKFITKLKLCLIFYTKAPFETQELEEKFMYPKRAWNTGRGGGGGIMYPKRGVNVLFCQVLH